MTGRFLWLAVVLVAGLGPVGCATPRAVGPDALATPGGTIRLEFGTWNEETSDLLREAVPEAAKALVRWGGLTEPVRIRVVNSRWELEEAVGRKFPGISAWARRNEVILWDPRWWPLPPAAAEDADLAARVRKRQVTGLLKHELTHSMMFQRSGGSPADPRDRIPFWFREGMAAVTAGEGDQWPPPEALSQWLEAHPGVDLLQDGSKLARTDQSIAYGAAYHAFDFLQRRYGDETVLRILDRMRVRRSFPDAFRDVLGIGVESFTSEFRRHLSWRGFVPSDPTQGIGPSLSRFILPF